MKKHAHYIFLLIEKSTYKFTEFVRTPSASTILLDRKTIIFNRFAHALQRYDPVYERVCLVIFLSLDLQELCDIFPEDNHHFAVVCA